MQKEEQAKPAAENNNKQSSVDFAELVPRVSTGIPAFDAITKGGLPQGELYLVNGAPGSGKTILALHFLQAGVQAGEKVLCISLSQRISSIKQTAQSVGIDVTGIVFCEFNSIEALQSVVEQQTVFDTSEIELEDTMSALTEEIENEQPDRVVFDGISHLRMLANDTLTYRKQLLILRDYMAQHDITVLLTDNQELAPGDGELAAIAHGVMTLSQEPTEYGRIHRYLRIMKIRGSAYQQGSHDMEISDRGIEIFPHSPRHEDTIPLVERLVKSSLPELDTLVGGGLLRGTSCLLIGPSGTGKTSIATLFASHVAQQGGKAAIFLFDELTKTFIERSSGLGMEVEQLVHQDRIRINEMNLGDISPGKFSSSVRQQVVDWGADLVVIDTLTGYLNSMPSSQKLVAQMHELLNYLSRQNVLSFLVVAQHGVVGPNLEVPVDVSYLADTVLLLRHFEAEGVLRQAISVYKKRYGDHERRIRELRFGSGSIGVGQPLSQFSGILSGTPQYSGQSQHLLDDE